MDFFRILLIFWIISKLLELIFYEGPTRARKERQLAPQASAGYPLSIDPTACLPQRGAGARKESFDEMTKHPRHS